MIGVLVGLVTWVIQVLIPLAVLAVIGLVVWNLLFAAPAPPPTTGDEPPKIAPGTDRKPVEPPRKRELSESEAARLFDEMKKKGK